MSHSQVSPGARIQEKTATPLLGRLGQTRAARSLSLPAKAAAGLRRILAQFPRHLLLPALFLLIALPVTTNLSVLVPLGSVPDEGNHVARAESLRHGEVIAGRQRIAGIDTVLAGGKIDPAVLRASSMLDQSAPLARRKLTAASWSRFRSVAWFRKLIFVPFPNTAVYAPLLYLPMTVALVIGRATGHLPHASIVLGRLLNAALFCLLGMTALLVAQRGRRLLFGTLLLPMSCWLAGSANIDGLLIAATALAAALLTRARGPHGAPWWSAAAILAVTFATKPPYLPLAAIMLVPILGTTRFRPCSQPRALGGFVGGVLLATLPGLLWGLAMALLVATPLSVHPAAFAGPLWPGDHRALFHGPDVAAQLRLFAHDPVLLVTLPLRTMRQDWGSVLRQAVGVLGTLDIVLPQALYQAWLAALALAIIGDMVRSPAEPANGSSWAGTLIVVGAAALTLLAIYDVQYLTWTDVGSTRIEGMQGRYLLPILVALPVGLPMLRQRFGPLLRRLLSLPLVGVALLSAGYLPWLVVETYYLR